MEKQASVELARTSGDGMEQDELGKNEQKTKVKNSDDKVQTHTELSPAKEKHITPSKSSKTCEIPGLHMIYRPANESQSRSLPPVIPKGKLYQLNPKLIKPPETPEHKKNRPPKFIPFEPYPGAVDPILPLKKGSNRIAVKTNRNNLDINVLVKQMSTMKTKELNSDNTDGNSAEDLENSLEISKLKEERDYFKSQLKFQVQVNSEIKNLLVASVGEDLQTKVNLLTEDKLQLARALLDTANNLTTHTEQIEFLAGQCEVWRSKFLASSVMIEELARWKADLTHKNSLLTNSNKQLLELIAQVREMVLEILKNLKFLANLKKINLPSSDIVNITSECLNISQQMVLHSGFGMPDSLNLNNLNPLTETEKLAIQALQDVGQTLMATDEAFRAIVCQARKPSASVYTSVEELSSGGNKN